MQLFSNSQRWLFGRWVWLAAATAIAALSFESPAASQGSTFETTAPHAILVDYETGAILYQKAADELIAPASMSKLMTLVVLLKEIRDGAVKLDDEFVMSVNAWRTGGAPSGTSAMFVPVNKTATVEQYLKGIIVQSGNDASIAVAEALSGTEAAFAERMTAMARKIGLEKSTFKNATGLDQDGHVMTARELAQLAAYLIRTYPDVYKIFAERLFEYRRHKFYNRNPLLTADIGVDGVKTGHTKNAGYSMVVSGVNEGRRLIGVVAGLKTANERKAEARKILTWGYRAFGTFKLFGADDTVGYARVWGGQAMYVALRGQGDVNVILPRYPANQKLKGEIVYDGPLKPPIAKGDAVAKLRVVSSTSAVSEVPLYAGEDVGKSSFAWQGFDSLLYLALGWLPL